MSKTKAKRIVKHGCYSVSNKDLKIKDKKSNYMNGEHDVFIMKILKKGYVIVKVITSLENIKSNGERTFHGQSLNAVREGKIIPIPAKKLNSNKLSGINQKRIKLHKSKLFKPNRNFKYPRDYDSIIK